MAEYQQRERKRLLSRPLLLLLLLLLLYACTRKRLGSTQESLLRSNHKIEKNMTTFQNWRSRFQEYCCCRNFTRSICMYIQAVFSSSTTTWTITYEQEKRLTLCRRGTQVKISTTYTAAVRVYRHIYFFNYYGDVRGLPPGFYHHHRHHHRVESHKPQKKKKCTRWYISYR